MAAFPSKPWVPDPQQAAKGTQATPAIAACAAPATLDGEVILNRARGAPPAHIPWGPSKPGAAQASSSACSSKEKPVAGLSPGLGTLWSLGSSKEGATITPG